MNNQNNPKIISVYGKKPRASKTSKRASILGLELFYQCSKGATGGGILIWHDKPPYQLIKGIWDFGLDNHITANDWVRDNIDEIRKRLADTKGYIFFEHDMVKRMNENT